MPSKAAFDYDASITTAQAAQMLGVTPSRVRQLVSERHIQQVGRGLTTPALAARGFADFHKSVAAKATQSATHDRVRDARAEEIELRVAEMKRDLVPVEDTYAAFDILVAACRAELSALPSRFTRDLDLRRKLQVEVDAGLNRISAALGASAKFMKDGGPLPGGQSEGKPAR